MFTGFVLPSAEELVLYFNIGALVFVLFFALIGYFRGFKKTLFYFVATVIIFVGGWFIKDIVVNFIRSYNLSSFNLTIADVQLQSLNQFIPDFIVSMFPQIGDAMTEETMIKELVFGLTNMFLRIVFIIILIIFAFTVFKLLVDVLWLIFKPKRKKGVKKRKKSLGNRMGGAGLNALKGAFYLLLILFPIGGIVSIANSIGQIASDVENQNTNYNLIFVGDSATLVATDTNSEPSLGDFDSILELLGVYTKSAPGKIFGTVKADTYLFDSLFSFEVNKTNIKLREELELVAKAFARSESLRENGFSLENLMNEDTDTLKLIVDDLSSLKLIKVAIPMAIEAALYLEDEEGNNLVSIPDGIDLDIDSIMEIDFAGDIKKLGYAFVDFTTLLPGEGEELNYLDLDPDTVSSVLESIGSTDIVDTLLPIAISYITTMESVQESLDQLGFTIDDFGLDEIDDWSNEFTQFGQIYRAVSDLQIKKFDESETFEYVTEDKVDALSEAMFESVLISNSVPVLVNVMSKSIITEEYQDMITVDPDIWDDVEFSALVNAAVTILKSGIVTDGEEAFKTMSSDTIDDLAKYLSRSRFITGNLNTITESLIGDMGFFSEDSEFATLEQDEWTQLELSSLFKAVRFILVEGTDNLTNLEDDKIIEISTYLGSSKFITRNINSVIDSALESIDLGTDIEFGEFKDMEDNEVASNELYYLFKSAKIITDKGSDVNAFLDLNDDELDIFLNSSFISGTLVNVLKAYSKPGEQLEFLVGVDDENVSWYDSDSEETTYTLNGNILTITPVEGATKYNIYGDGVKLGATRSLTFELTPPLPTEIVVEAFIEGELRRMFIAIGSLSSSLSDGGSFSTDTITNLTDEEIDNIMISDILVLSIIGEIEKMANEDEPFIVIPDGNLKSTDQEIKLAAWKNKVDDNVVKDGELSKIFKGLRIFLAGSDIDNFDIQNVTNMPDEDIIEVLKSEIISESIIVQIEKEADKDEAIVVIPEGEDLGKNDPRTEWLNSYTYVGADLVLDEVGELYHILRALRVLVGGGSIDDIDVNNILEEENREIVLTSKVMEMTIINKIIETADEDDAVITIPYNIRNSSNFMAWKKVDGQGEGELRKVLNSLSYLMDDGESITDFNFDLSKVLDNKDEILKSEIFIETIISKISEQSEINIPVGAEYGLNDVEDRSAWQNIYDLDINNNYKYDEQDKVIVTSYGEVNSILEAVDIIIEPDPITGEKSFDNITFNISVAFEANNQEVILSSLVISETILQKVFDEEINGTVTIPSALYLNTRDDTSRDKWFSDYNNGSLVEKNELAHLLDAVNIITDGGDFEGMTFDISKVYGANQELVLKSKVISETIVKKVFDESLNGDVVIPSDIYLNQELDENRDKWYNSYNGDLLLGKGEIAHLIDAVNILTGGETFEGLNFDLSQAFDEVNQPIILQSKVISETIVKKIFDESTTGNVKVPSVLYVNELVDPNRDKWFNDYNGDVLTYKGEIAYLLDAVDILTDGDTFEGMNFDLSQAFDEEKQPQILMSKVISETIVKKVFEESNSGEIKVPSDIYVNAESDQSRDKWFNEYNGDVLTYKGEIAYLLDAVDILTGGDTFEGMNFDLSQAFDEVNQPKILMSKVISETIVKKVFEESNSGEIKVPSDIYVNIESDPNRDKWFNDYNGDVLTYKGEIAYLLDAVNILTNGEDFAGMTFDLSQAFDEEN
ncbi:MAG: CvpA family protein, partial [Bacilli bacterium]